mmetsp:Transcript_7388/g.25866  ORF Transcript_7388/g.25866 Transcript_7388/m.25866 type:complete len:263 (-) Transcript_7388:445-1233(-)
MSEFPRAPVANKKSCKVRGDVSKLARRAAGQGSKADRTKKAVTAGYRNSAAECVTNSRLPAEPDRDKSGRNAIEDDVRKISTSGPPAQVAEILCRGGRVAKVEPLARHEPVRLAEADEQETSERLGPAAVVRVALEVAGVARQRVYAAASAQRGLQLVVVVEVITVAGTQRATSRRHGLRAIGVRVGLAVVAVRSAAATRIKAWRRLSFRQRTVDFVTDKAGLAARRCRGMPPKGVVARGVSVAVVASIAVGVAVVALVAVE